MGGNAIGGENHSTTPNCVILDEIDGVDNKAAIEMLCTMLKAPLLPPNKRSGKYSVPVTRPIICICNDPYVPALRSLRKLCKVFVFQSPVETRLVQRLKQICTAEGLKDMSTSALMNLCTMHGNDIRSCINTLQFSVGSHVHGSQSSSATLQRNLQLGVKDEQLNVFHLWRAIFSKKDAIAMLHHESVKAGHAEQVKAADSIGFLSIVEEFGDDSLVLNGVHENLLDVPFIDPCMTKTAEVYDWLSLADTHASPGSAHASYGSVASSFVGAAVVATHNAAAVDRRVSLTWPRKVHFPHTPISFSLLLRRMWKCITASKS